MGDPTMSKISMTLLLRSWTAGKIAIIRRSISGNVCETNAEISDHKKHYLIYESITKIYATNIRIFVILETNIGISNKTEISSIKLMKQK